MSDDPQVGAILTPSQRAYLRGERSHSSDASKRMARKRIRERIRATLADMELLLEHVPDEVEEAVAECSPDEQLAAQAFAECVTSADGGALDTEQYLDAAVALQRLAVGLDELTDKHTK